MMKVLKIEPVSFPEIMEMNNDLFSLQMAVGGYIEVIYPWEDKVCVICNEEGKLKGEPLNRALYDEEGKIYDIIAGTFLIVGITEDDFCSLTEEQINKYKTKFKRPEIWLPDV